MRSNEKHFRSFDISIVFSLDGNADYIFRDAHPKIIDLIKYCISNIIYIYW